MQEENIKIILLGATGYTGMLVAEKLAEEKLYFTATGRSMDKLDLLRKVNPFAKNVLLFETEKSESLTELISGADIVINCIGPYNRYGDRIVVECKTHNCLYLDISGEQDFIKRSFEHSQTQSTIVHSVSFESCLADLLALELVEENKSYKDISSFYRFGHARPSPGTKLTMQVSRNYPTYIFEDEKLNACVPLEKEHKVEIASLPDCDLGIFMPYPEILFFSKKYKTQRSGSFMLLPNLEAKFMRSSVQKQEGTDTIVKKHNDVKYKGPTPAQRQKQEFYIIVSCTDMERNLKSIGLKGTDMYGLTASLIVQSLKYYLKTGSRAPGVLSPSEFLGPQFLNDFIIHQNLTLVKNEEFAII
jgi:short subunit dehydrogenase-like uncharacterized protein